VKPSEAIAVNKCPGCLGTGTVYRFVPYEGYGSCSICEGSGEWPPRDWDRPLYDPLTRVLWLMLLVYVVVGFAGYGAGHLAGAW
jgi:hypothetical protein